MEKSCFLIKPGKESDLIAINAVKIAESLGLTVNFKGSEVLSLKEASAFYKEFEKEPWFFQFMAYFTSGEVRAYFTEGEDAIEKTLEVKRQIRAKYAIDKQKNAIHAPEGASYVQETLLLIEKFF